MRANNDELWRQIVQRLDAAYSVLGKDALEKMTAIEVHVLYAEKQVAVRQATEWLKKYPCDELGDVRLNKAKLEVTDIAQWLKAKQQLGRDTGKGRGPDR